jgi:twitching motility protein PilT
MARIDELLRQLKDQAGSDLHLAAGIVPRMRTHGELHPIEAWETLTDDSIREILREVSTDEDWRDFEACGDLDFAYGLEGVARFRANYFVQENGAGAVFRIIPEEILSIEDLKLPKAVEGLCDLKEGLVLITGPTGSGKSTTLAAVIDHINRNHSKHIVTIEDPVEFLHQHKKCIVNQRELNADTLSFTLALKSVLRQDPDVVLIGEMRDHETVEAALRIAETGHLTFATLHTNSAAQTINRIIDIFPAHQQSQIRVQLSFVLEGVLCQSLLPRASGSGRCMAMEVLIPNSAIRNLIREDKIHQIYGMMQTGQSKFGMQTFNQSLAALYARRMIDLKTALNRSSKPDELQEIIARAAVAGDQSGRPIRAAR